MTKRLLAFALVAIALADSAAAQTTIVPGRNWIYRLNGSAAAPSDTYDSDRNLGRYRIGADNEGATANGILQWDWNTSRMKLRAGYTLDFDTISLSEADVTKVDGVTCGTVTASRFVCVDSNKDAASFRNITMTGWAKVGAGSVGAPSLTILDSSSNVDNGFYSPGVDQVGVVTNGASYYTFSESALSIGGGNSVSITHASGSFKGPGTVAATGVVRLPNTSSGAIRWRNAANNDDLGLYANGLDQVESEVVFKAPGVTIGNNPSTTGAVRLANNISIKARNAANSADVFLVTLNASDELELASSAGAIVPGSGDGTGILGSTGKRFSSANFSSSVAVGANPATTGAVRLGNNLQVIQRNAANSADLGVIGINSSNVLGIGDTSNTVYTALYASMWGLGGITSSFPAFKRNGVIVEAKLADDSAYTQLRALSLESGATPATAGALRFSYADSWQGRNNANDGNVEILRFATWGGVTDRIVMDPNGQGVIFPGSIALGAAPATGGAIRLSNNTQLSLSPSGGGEATGVGIDGANQVILGDDSLVTLLKGSNVKVSAGIEAQSAGYFRWASRAHIKSAADSQITLFNDAESVGVIVAWGSASPEGSLPAGVGSVYHRTGGGAGTSFYVKESGSGNTGWVAK